MLDFLYISMSAIDYMREKPKCIDVQYLDSSKLTSFVFVVKHNSKCVTQQKIAKK